MPIIYFFAIIILIFVLVKSADLIEDGVVIIAQKLRISTFIIGFILVSLASSLPELSIAINSSFEGVPELSTGNLIGATIVLITFVLALNVFKANKIPLRGEFGIWELELSVLVLVLQVVFLLDQRLSFLDGLIMLTVYGVFAFYISYHNRKHARSSRMHKVMSENHHVSIKVLAKTGLGLIGLLICSRVIVDLGVIMSAQLHIHESIIGLIVLGLGTNLPEITILFRAHNTATQKLAVGNLIGSATVNTATMGLLGILSPFTLTNFASALPGLLILAAALIILILIARSRNQIDRHEGFLMLGIYISFLVTQLFILSRA